MPSFLATIFMYSPSRRAHITWYAFTHRACWHWIGAPHCCLQMVHSWGRKRMVLKIRATVKRRSSFERTRGNGWAARTAACRWCTPGANNARMKRQHSVHRERLKRTQGTGWRICCLQMVRKMYNFEQKAQASTGKLVNSPGRKCLRAPHHLLHSRNEKLTVLNLKGRSRTHIRLSAAKSAIV
jgi:hypothetical protein